MQRRERYIARLDEVTITRKGDGAIVEYREQGVPATHLRIGPDLVRMTDERVLEIFTESLRAQAWLAAEYKHVVIEVPLGSPQMEYAEGACQWVPRGHVLRCAVGDDEAGQLVVAYLRPSYHRCVVSRLRSGWIDLVRLQGANGNWRDIIARVEHDMLAELHLQMMYRITRVCVPRYRREPLAIAQNSIH